MQSCLNLLMESRGAWRNRPRRGTVYAKKAKTECAEAQQKEIDAEEAGNELWTHSCHRDLGCNHQSACLCSIFVSSVDENT